MDDQFDPIKLREAQEYAKHLKAQYAERNRIMDQMEKMLMLVWDEEARVKRVMKDAKITLSPVARNKLLGAVRLLTVVDPSFSVPRDRGQEVNEVSDKLETYAETLWKRASAARGEPLHYDAVLSILTFGEMHIAVTKTEHMVEQAKGANKLALKRLNNLAEETPYVFDLFDPRSGYPDLGAYGLNAFYRETKTTAGQIMDDFGERGKRVLKTENRYQEVTLCHIFDTENRQYWLGSNMEQPLLQEQHGWDFFPVEVSLGEGSRLLTRPEWQRQPFLYGLYQSGLWHRQNLILTVLFNLALKIGTAPMMLYKANAPGKELTLDLSRVFGVATIEKDEDLLPLLKQVIDPSLMEAWRIAVDLGEESTIYGQTLGEPVGGSAGFSLTALLHQAGRLPLMVPQRKASAGIANIMKAAIDWVKFDGQKSKVSYGDRSAELAASEIPNHYLLEAKLEVKLPQDQLQNATLAQQMRGFMPDRWIRENVLNEGQSDALTKEIWDEQAEEMFYRQYMEDQMQGPPPAQNVPGLGGEIPSGIPGGMVPGMPTPEMAMNGGQPPYPMPMEQG